MLTMATTLVYHPEGLAAIRHRVERAHDNVVDAVHRDAFRHAAKRTGRMAASITRRDVRRLVSRITVGGKGIEYWPTVEYGSHPHVIRPRKKQALHWPTAVHPVKRVNHPGTPAQPFMRRALYKRRILIVKG